MPSTDGGTVQVATIGAEGIVTPTVFGELEQHACA
jgi:hypothetical protein